MRFRDAYFPKLELSIDSKICLNNCNVFIVLTCEEQLQLNESY